MNRIFGKICAFAIAMALVADPATITGQLAFAATVKSQAKKDRYRFQPKTIADKNLHRRFIAGRPMTATQLRRLADQGDRFAAYRFAKLLDRTPKSRPDDVAHYYSIAANLGQRSSVAPLIGLIRLHAASMSPLRLANAEKSLLHAVAMGNLDAALALSQFYRDGKPFGLHEETGRKLLKRAADAGNADAAFEYASLLLAGTTQESDRQEAQRYLAIAAKSGNLIARSLMSEGDTPQ